MAEGPTGPKPNWEITAQHLRRGILWLSDFSDQIIAFESPVCLDNRLIRLRVEADLPTFLTATDQSKKLTPVNDGSLSRHSGSISPPLRLKTQKIPRLLA